MNRASPGSFGVGLSAVPASDRDLQIEDSDWSRFGYAAGRGDDTSCAGCAHRWPGCGIKMCKTLLAAIWNWTSGAATSLIQKEEKLYHSFPTAQGIKVRRGETLRADPIGNRHLLMVRGWNAAVRHQKIDHILGPSGY